MKHHPRWTKNFLIFGGSAIWGLLLISCVVTSRTLVAPPMVAGATYVGDEACADCHESLTSNFHTATHAKLVAPGSNAEEIGCEACHGAGSIHVDEGGGAGTIINPGESPETCFQCHLEKRGEFNLPSAHPVMNGKMSCSDCHNVHTGDAISEGVSSLSNLNETCVKCHASQDGPYVFEHEASREGCVTCHMPHGSVNDKMLKVRNANLCLQCHFQEQTSSGVIQIGNRNHTGYLPRGTCWSAGCHENVHGSHTSSSLRY